MDTATTGQEQIIEKFTLAAQYIDNAKQEIARHIIGYDIQIDQLLASIVAGGHVLLVGMPGVGKTRLMLTTAQVLGLHFQRVQATPDLMPSDILGTEIFKQQSESFDFVQGPIFTQFLMMDEINRATPRTQSALLEAMQERQVTISGKTYGLPQPFYVVATQNPIEQDGTFQLPEAQIDRFMCRLDLSYPDEMQERDIVYDTVISSEQTGAVQPILNANFVLQATQLVKHMPMSEGILNAIVATVRHTRSLSQSEDLAIVRGAGPRASQYIVAMARAIALVRGNAAVTPQDVSDVILPVLRHRVALHFEGYDDSLRTKLDQSLLENLYHHMHEFNV